MEEQLYMNPTELKKKMINGLLELIDNVPDEDSPEARNKLTTYLNGLLRTKGVIPPTSEIMTIIQHQKPKLFHATRFHLPAQSHLQILFQISMDPELAANRLQNFVKS